MKERSAYQVITEVKSAPVGIDWLMIKAAKEAVQRQKDSQKQVSVNFDANLIGVADDLKSWYRSFIAYNAGKSIVSSRELLEREKEHVDQL